MSWSPDLFIGELRPWPDSVHVVRGNTDETRRYTPERKDVQEALERRIDELCQKNERLRKTISEINQLAVMSANVTRETQDRLCNENIKLRELVDELYPLADYGAMDASELDRAHDLMRELGIEVPS